MNYILNDEHLKIYASDGILSVIDGDGKPNRISELTLIKLESIYKIWQHLIKTTDENLAQVLISDKPKLREIIKILKSVGFQNPLNFTPSQIKALLFYYDGGHSILWRFHSVYPVLDLPSSDNLNIDFQKHVGDLNPFETAQLYLIQSDKEHLAEDMPLSKIMKLFSTKAFITWISDPKNREKLELKDFKDEIKKNPLNPDDIRSMLKKAGKK